jgi:hypothetical protein
MRAPSCCKPKHKMHSRQHLLSTGCTAGSTCSAQDAQQAAPAQHRMHSRQHLLSTGCTAGSTCSSYDVPRMRTWRGSSTGRGCSSVIADWVAGDGVCSCFVADGGEVVVTLQARGGKRQRHGCVDSMARGRERFSPGEIQVWQRRCVESMAKTAEDPLHPLQSAAS